ncbi:TROVE domain-containing protein [Saccharibacillus sp. CPCC 101409]|uniref:TROVE domain-containing protein n=1 Tax=Saccharibacillus sp. CPCC 101409 TaxID=3058041 RepID=UPI0026713E57|nr:TROVE domain-containing protein [Saccharibacillus sp. CPCC 101409]MDO3408339.1 TROVE domain-containing protein [Saccharibacillus sp. CPCC 101409]
MSRAVQHFTEPLYTQGNYPAYNRSIEEEYLQMLLTNTLGRTFYAGANELLAQAAESHETMAELNPEFMAKALVFARRQGFMRLQPVYGLAVLSKARPDLFVKVFKHVVLIPPDLTDFLTILKGMGRGQGGRAVKRQVASFLQEASEYWAIKYGGRGRGYNLGDAIATAHPVPADERQQALFRYLRGHETTLAGLPQIAAVEQLKRAGKDKERIRLIREGKLPYETVTGAVTANKKIWEALLRQMPMFALLRHLNTFEREGLLEHPQHLRYVTERLTDAEALRKSKILPMRFATAYDQVKRSALKEALAEAVDLTFASLPELPGRTAILLDISGSMEGQYLRTGSVFALALYKKTGGNSIFLTFDHEVHDPKPSRTAGIMSQAARIKAKGGTDTGLPVRYLTDLRENVDHIIMITDEQQNAGSPFYKELQRYRAKINRDAKAFIVDLAPYRSAMVPQEDANTHYIYGWSDQVLSYISAAARGFDSMSAHVARMDLDRPDTGKTDGKDAQG